MVPDVSMCHTQQFCGCLQEIGTPGTIYVMGYAQEPLPQRIGIFTANTYGISGDHPQELLQKKIRTS